MIKFSAWLLAIFIIIVISLVYLNISGFDGGYTIQLIRGDEAYKSSNYAKAMVHYKKAASISPKNSIPQIKMANTLVSLGKADEAISMLEEFIQKDPLSREVYDLLLSLYHENNAPKEKQLNVLKKASELFGDSDYAKMAGELEKKPDITPPKLNIEGGKYSTPQTIKVININEGEKVYYTTDGKTKPTNKSKVYKNDGINISKTTTLMLVKYSNGQYSDVVEQVYEID